MIRQQGVFDLIHVDEQGKAKLTEHCNAIEIKTELIEMKSSVKMVVLYEVHKVFDRNYNFRSRYDSFQILTL